MITQHLAYNTKYCSIFHPNLSMLFSVLDAKWDVGSFQKQKKYALNPPKGFYTSQNLRSKITSKEDKVYHS